MTRRDSILDRRSFLTACAAGAIVGGSGMAGSGVALAQETVNTDDLHAPGQLGEKVLGPADAKVTVVEYASMSCSHCARFDSTTFDDFRLKYVDTGKVRYIFREFPLDAPGYAAAMVSRCAPADKYFDVVHTYFRSQQVWAGSTNVKGALMNFAKPFGFSEQSFDACISNQALYEGIEAVKERGVSFGVQATPTFFINGVKYEGALTLAELDQAIEPLL